MTIRAILQLYYNHSGAPEPENPWEGQKEGQTKNFALLQPNYQIETYRANMRLKREALLYLEP